MNVLVVKVVTVEELEPHNQKIKKLFPYVKCE